MLFPHSADLCHFIFEFIQSDSFQLRYQSHQHRAATGIYAAVLVCVHSRKKRHGDTSRQTDIQAAALAMNRTATLAGPEMRGRGRERRGRRGPPAVLADCGRSRARPGSPGVGGTAHWHSRGRRCGRGRGGRACPLAASAERRGATGLAHRGFGGRVVGPSLPGKWGRRRPRIRGGDRQLSATLPVSPARRAGFHGLRGGDWLRAECVSEQCVT